MRVRIGTKEFRSNVKIAGAAQISFEPLPEGVELGNTIITMTEEGNVFGVYEGYNTVYRKIGKKTILSCDGSVYVQPEESLEEKKRKKKEEVAKACESAIYAGITVELTEQEHFALTEKDQINLFGKMVQLQQGAQRLEYHQDNHPCRYYTAEEMAEVITKASEHVSWHTTYCNALNMWIAEAETLEEVGQIFYGAEVPEAYQSEVLIDYIERRAADGEAEG